MFEFNLLSREDLSKALPVFLMFSVPVFLPLFTLQTLFLEIGFSLFRKTSAPRTYRLKTVRRNFSLSSKKKGKRRRRRKKEEKKMKKEKGR